MMIPDARHFCTLNPLTSLPIDDRYRVVIDVRFGDEVEYVRALFTISHGDEFGDYSFHDPVILNISRDTILAGLNILESRDAMFGSRCVGVAAFSIGDLSGPTLQGTPIGTCYAR